MLAKRLYRFTVGLFVTGLIYTLIEQIINGYSKDSWGVTELLINYQGGFVRRGLLGEIIYQFVRLTGFSPYNIILIICLCCLFGLAIYLIRLFKKQGISLYVLLLPMLLGGAILNDFWLRKDLLLVILFVSVLSVSQKRSFHYYNFKNVIMIAALLIHESIGFWGLPILLILNFNKETQRPQTTLVIKALRSTISYLPAIVVFIICLMHPGNEQTANDIWASWSGFSFPQEPVSIQELPAAIDGLTWSFSDALNNGKRTLTNFDTGLYAPLIWLIILFLCYLILTNLDKFRILSSSEFTTHKADQLLLSNLLIVQLVFILPLFILGWDYGRWTFFWIMSVLIVFLTVPRAQLQITSDKMNFISRPIIDSMNSIFPKSRTFYYYLPLFLGIPSAGWALSLYVETTPVYVILEFISLLIRQIALL